MHSGDSKLLKVSVKATGGVAVDISGVDIRFQLARTANNRPPLISKTVGDGITIVDGAAGRFDVLLDPEDTQALSGTYYYEGEIDDAGTISTVLWGNVQINPDLIEPVT
jgi:hypothetical protein